MAKDRSLILSNQEQHFSLRSLAKKLPESYSYFSLRLWCLVGKRIGKKTVRMESINGPGGRRSSVEAYRRFIAAIN